MVPAILFINLSFIRLEKAEPKMTAIKEAVNKANPEPKKTVALLWLELDAKRNVAS